MKIQIKFHAVIKTILLCSVADLTALCLMPYTSANLNLLLKVTIILFVITFLYTIYFWLFGEVDD